MWGCPTDLIRNVYQTNDSLNKILILSYWKQFQESWMPFSSASFKLSEVHTILVTHGSIEWMHLIDNFFIVLWPYNYIVKALFANQFIPKIVFSLNNSTWVESNFSHLWASQWVLCKGFPRSSSNLVAAPLSSESITGAPSLKHSI